jgi:hypothetical protein
LPYLVCKGVSEDDTWALKYNVGVVSDGFSREEGLKLSPAIRKFFEEDKAVLRSRCRAAGIAYRGYGTYKKTSHLIFKTLAENH